MSEYAKAERIQPQSLGALAELAEESEALAKSIEALHLRLEPVLLRGDPTEAIPDLVNLSPDSPLRTHAQRLRNLRGQLEALSTRLDL